MDLMYLPDAIGYPSIRATSQVYYEHNEPLWTKQQQATGKPQTLAKRAVDGNHSSCPLCKERQRRRLASYIRTKSRQDSESAIEEEAEGEDQPQETSNQAQK